MPYDSSKEKSLQKFEVPDYKSKPEWGGTLIEVYEYEGKYKARVQRYYIDKSSGTKKISNFVSIPANAEGLIELSKLLKDIKTRIDAKIDEQKKV